VCSLVATAITIKAPGIDLGLALKSMGPLALDTNLPAAFPQRDLCFPWDRERLYLSTAVVLAVLLPRLVPRRRPRMKAGEVDNA